MPKTLDTIESARESYGEYILGLLAQAEDGIPGAWAKIQDRFVELPPADQADVLEFLTAKNFLQVIKDVKGNRVLSLTEKGRDRARQLI